MKIPASLILVLGLLCLSLKGGPADLDRATEQFRAFCLSSSERVPSNLASRSYSGGGPNALLGLRYASELREDGSWADINYADKARSNWGPFSHVQRMVAMAAVFNREGLRAADRELLLRATRKAGAYWRQHDFICPNWWANEIGVPLNFGEFALLMGKDLSPEDHTFITGTILARSGIRKTGQNKVWLSGNVLVRSLLLRDEAGASQAAEAIWSEVAVMKEEGMQPDWSFHQHGPQQQFGNYGLGFAVEITRWVTILRGTSLALPPERMYAFSHYLLEGMNWVCWRGEMDPSACGRQLTPHSPLSKTSTLKRVYENMRLADPGQSARYAAFIARNEFGAANDLVGSRFFWRSDYGIHRRPDFFASLKMHSERVIGVEVVNTENLAGRFLADGALFVFSKGGEYADIFPVWDWRHIPGVTQEWNASIPKTGKPEDRQMTRLVGGVADEAGMTAMMDYDRDGVAAHKAWFFHEDRIVCLGAGIRSEQPGPIHTTVNQGLLRGALGRESMGILVQHDGLRYLGLGGSRLQADSATRTGHWSRVFTNPGTPKEERKAAVFTIWIDHGVKPAGASYAYVIERMGDEGPRPGLLANTPALQAVRWADGLVQVCFWAAGELALGEAGEGRVLRADAPCVVQVENTPAGWRLVVAEPSQRLATLKLSLGNWSRTLVLPSGLEAGSALTVRVE